MKDITMAKRISVKAIFGSLGLWLGWMMITVLSALAVEFIFTFYLDLCGCNSFNIIEDPDQIQMNFIFGLISLIFASIFGVVQWLFLRKMISRAGNWIWATVIGAAVGSAVVSILPVQADIIQKGNIIIFPTAVYGVFQAAAQWLFINKKISNAYLWLISALLGWSFIIFAVGFSERAGLERFEIPGAVFGILLIGTAAVFLFGIPDRRKFNAAVLGSLSVIFIFGAGISSRGIFNQHNRQIMTLTAADCNESFIHSIAFSPDNQRLAAGFNTHCAPENQPITVWDIPSGKELFSIRSEPTTEQVAFSPDGSVLVSTHAYYAVLWDASSGQKLRKIPISSGYPRYLAFSPDGQVLAVGNYSNDGTITLWDMQNDKVLKRLGSANGAVTQLAVSPDGNLMVVYTDQIVSWEIQTARKIRSWSVKPYITRGSPLAVSPTERTLIDVGAVWNLETGVALPEFTTKNISPAGFSPDGNIAALTLDHGHAVRLWNLVVGREITTFQFGEKYIQTMAFSPNSRLFAAGFSDGNIRIFNLQLKQ